MKQLGIEPIFLVAQIVNFVIIVFLLSRLLYKPILAMLEKRKKEIADGIELTEKMRIEEEKLAVKRSKVLETARSEAQAIVAEAKKKAQAQAEAILDQANTEAGSLVEKGKSEISLLRKSMEKEMRTYAVSLAVAMAKRLLDVSLPVRDREKILEKHLKDLETVQATA